MILGFFTSFFPLQMVSYELLIRSNLNLILCWISLTLNLAYSPHELPEMQRNCSPALCCLLLLERSPCTGWLPLVDGFGAISSGNSWNEPELGLMNPSRRGHSRGVGWVHCCVWEQLELAGPGNKICLFAPCLTVPFCSPLCALITVRDAPARCSSVHPRELSSLMSREGQPTEELVGAAGGYRGGSPLWDHSH